jgi:predicted CopG family antitoxin
MVTKTINIRESAYNALRARKREGESYSDVILRITEGEEAGVCEYLQTIDQSVRSEIARSVKDAKAGLERVRPRKVSL